MRPRGKKEYYMHWIDWLFVAAPIVLILWVGIYTQRYMKSVADFLSGGRLAGRYLLAVAKGEQGAGPAVFVALFELISKSGFIVLSWWSWLAAPIAMLVSISGWVVYRFRETRALTLAQFFEIRYSKSFRLFTGFLGFGAGILNFGVIPVIGARFLTVFFGLPQAFVVGGWTIPTHLLMMAIMLTVTLLMTISGGLITLMITNCLEGMISQVLFVVIIIGLLMMFSWTEISEVLIHQPAGQSLLNPFDSSGVADFNIFYVLIGIWGLFYRNMAWQNQSAYSTAAITAHESRMGSIMSSWKGMGNMAVIVLLTICAMTYLKHPDFADKAVIVRSEIAQIPQEQIQRQMTIPIAVEHMLPIGLKGALCVVLLMGVFGGDGTHIHSWGSLFIQDVIVPFRRKPFTPEQHIRLLRWSMSGVALFAFLFGCFFQQTEYVAMWWAVTEALYVGGAGIAVIGGLYWKKGTTAGAWAGLLTGSTLITGGIVARQLMEEAFPLNGAEISFFGSLTAVAVYVLVSLLTCKEDFNMDRLLHRGKYAVQDEKEFQTQSEKKVSWGKIIGLDDNFTRGDKWLAGGLFGWSLLWFAVFVVGSVWNLISPWSIQVWSSFWYVVGIGIPIMLSVTTAIWFTWGGVLDMKKFFQRIKLERVNDLDNGMVVGHQNLAEVRSEEKKTEF
jgi:solute:Na+ symporter, SSS family